MKKLKFSSMSLIMLFGAAWLSVPAYASPAYKPASSFNAVLDVGPGEQYTTPQAAYDAASPGDLIRIYAATYRGNGAKLLIRGTNNVTFRGVSGRPHMQLAPGDRPTKDRGIWVDAANNITIENIEFSGSRRPTPKFYPGSGNGAGIYVPPVTNVTIRHCYFHDNDDGILTADSPQSHVIIEYSEFARNGHGAGESHDIYIGNNILTFRYNFVHGANNGNLLKTRAHLNYIEYNRITYGRNPNYVANYDIDIPDGGIAYVIGNVVEQAAFLNLKLNNYNMLEYGVEHRHHYAHNALYVINNTFVNNASDGGFLFLHNNPSLVVLNKNNIFTGAGTLLTGEKVNITSSHNYRGDPGYVDAASLDYHLSSASSPAVDAGASLGSADGHDLTPQKEYVHVVMSKDRYLSGQALDLGAFEFAAGEGSDTSPPAAVTDLSTFNRDIHSVKLKWTAPGDNGESGQAARYDVRYSRAPITKANWHKATETTSELYQKPAGNQMVFQVNELRTGVRYYFAVKTIDSAGNVSGLSNVMSAKTYRPTPDHVTVYSLDGLRTAINSAPARGRVITLAPKTYRQTRDIAIRNKNNITIQGATSDFNDTVISGIGNNNRSTMTINFKIFNSGYITFKNLTIEDSYDHAIQLKPGSTYFVADHIKTWNNGESGFKVTAPSRYDLGLPYNDYGTIENCLIGNTIGGYRVAVEGIDIVAGKGWAIRGNTFTHILKIGGNGVAYAFFAKGNSIGTIVQDNVVKDSFIAYSFGGGGTGRRFFRNNNASYESRGGIIRNNIAYNIIDSGIYMNKSHDFQVYNNTLMNVGQDGAGAIGSRFPQSSGVIRSNLTDAPIKKRNGGSAIVSNNITNAANDLFVNPSAGNYHLKSTAMRAIDQVKIFSHSVRFDFDGQVRPYGAGWDIGADEYVPGANKVRH